MARAYTQIFCSIWDNDDFCALSSDAQRTYFMLTSQDDIGAAGVLAIRLRRWSRTLPAADRDKLDPSIKELVAAGYVYEDDDTEELLVRSFVKWDGGYKHSKRVLAVVASAEAIKSQSLRNVMASELDKLDVKHAIQVRSDSHSIANREAFDSEPDANGYPIDSGRVVVTEVSTYHNPQTTTPILDPETTTGEPAAQRGAKAPPPEFCDDHPNGTDKACAACGRRRVVYEAWDRDHALAETKARDARIRAAQDAAINQDLNRGPVGTFDRSAFEQAKADTEAALAARKTQADLEADAAQRRHDAAELKAALTRRSVELAGIQGADA